MQSGGKKVLELRKSLIHIGSQLYLSSGTLFDQFLPETAKVLQMQQADVIGCIEPVRLHHESFGNEVSIDLIRFGLANVIFTQGGSLDRVEDTDPVVVRHKEFNKVVAVMSRRFKTNDEAVLLKGIESGDQLKEAIIVIRKFERLEDYFTVRGYSRGEKVFVWQCRCQRRSWKHLPS